LIQMLSTVLPEDRQHSARGDFRDFSGAPLEGKSRNKLHLAEGADGRALRSLNR